MDNIPKNKIDKERNNDDAKRGRAPPTAGGEGLLTGSRSTPAAGRGAHSRYEGNDTIFIPRNKKPTRATAADKNLTTGSSTTVKGAEAGVDLARDLTLEQLIANYPHSSDDDTSQHGFSTSMTYDLEHDKEVYLHRKLFSLAIRNHVDGHYDVNNESNSGLMYVNTLPLATSLILMR